MSSTTSKLRRVARAVPLLAVCAAAVALPATASAGVSLSTSGWQWSDPQPQGYTLSDVQFAGPRGYAVGKGGTALRSDDGGATWSGLPTGTSSTLGAVDEVDPNTIVVSSGTSSDGNAACALRISRDGGATFSELLVGNREDDCTTTEVRSFNFPTPQVGYVMQVGGAVLKTTDGGATLGSASTVDGGTSLRFVDANTGYAVGGSKIYRTTDGAQTWTPLLTAPAALTAVRVIDAQHIIAWGADLLETSSDGGTTWAQTGLAGATPTRVSWDPSNPAHLAFVAANKLLLTPDAGSTFQTETVGNNDALSAAYVDSSRLVAVGTDGVIYASADAGATFARLSSNSVAARINALVSSSAGPIGLGDGGVARQVNGSWVLNATLSSASVISADFSSQNNGYVLNSDGTMLHTVSNGATWSRVDPGTPSGPSIVVTPNDATTLLFGTFGVYRATGGGAFQKVTSKALSGAKVIGASGSGARIAAWVRGAHKKPLLSSDSGASWRAIPLPKGAGSISEFRTIPGSGLLLVAGSKLYRSPTDKGKWTEITSLGNNLGFGNQVTASSGSELWTAGSTLWGTPVVLHSTDSGKSWQPQGVGAGDALSVFANGPHSAFAFSSGGSVASGLFSTVTGGAHGAASVLSLARTKSKLKRSGGKIQVVGQLTGGKGGEVVSLALRKLGSAKWTQQFDTVGANAGSITGSFRVTKGKYTVVAQWAGDSTRAGFGTSARSITVK